MLTSNTALLSGFSRASTGTYFDQTGTMQTAAANAPRFDYTPSPVTRTNLLRNSIGVGATLGTLGSGGALPRNWLCTPPSGMSVRLVKRGLDGSMPFIDFQISGTPAATGTLSLYFDATTGIAATSGTTLTHSVYARLMAGTATPVKVGLAWNDSLGNLLSTAVLGGAGFLPDHSALVRQRYKVTVAAPSSTGYTQPVVQVPLTIGVAVNMTLRLAAPQLEAYGWATPYIRTMGSAVSVTGCLPLGMLLESGSTNSIRNPRGEGLTVGTVGSSGVLPTYWAHWITNIGINIDVLGQFTVQGVPVTRLRIYGTPTSTTGDSLNFESWNDIAAAPGQTWTMSLYARLVAGSTAGFNGGLSIRARPFQINGSGGTSSTTPFAGFTPTSTLQRFVATGTYSSSDATTAYTNPQLYLPVSQGVPVDVTLDLCPQLEQLPFASSLTLPPVGSPAASTRASETCPIATSGWFAQNSAQRTNLCLQSSTFANSPWASSGATLVSGKTDPAGGTTAYKLQEDTTAGVTHFVSQTINSFTAGQKYTISCYMKADGRQYGRINLPTTAIFGSQLYAFFDLNAGALTTQSSPAPTSSLITSVGNGWYRCSITVTATGTGSGQVQIMPSSSSTSSVENGDGASGIDVWGAQIEAGDTATSYVPTTSAAASVTDALPGTLLIEGDMFDANDPNRHNGIGQIDDGTNNNRIGFINIKGSQNIQLELQGPASFVAVGAAAGVSGQAAFRTAAAFDGAGNATISSNAQSPASKSGGSGSNFSRLNLGYCNGNYLNGHIRRLDYWPTQRPNDTLQALSS